jgi:hypothetical protein
MSQKEMTYTLGHQEVSESSAGNLSKLVGLARQAYEQKRTKDCLDLTRAILLIDPDNADAQWMRSSVQSQMHQDLENARAFLIQAQSKDGPEAVAAPSPVDSVERFDSEREVAVPSGVREPLRLVPASSGTRVPKTRWVWIAGVLVVSGLVVGGFLRVVSRRHPAQSSQGLSTLNGSKSIANANTSESGAQPPAPSVNPGSVPVADSGQLLPVATAVPPAVEQRLTEDKSAALPMSSTRPSARQELPILPAGQGTLAVSSPASLDIYEGSQYLGSAPVSLTLSTGTHTLEYRHGNLQRTVTQVISANETARSMIAFDATVQINSRPWAEVFIDGADRKDLGQTPLSGVRVPIGSVLIFQNPQFQPKKYRVTGNETGIQIVFP